MLQAFKCDQGSWEGLEGLIKQLPSTPDAVISNAALGSATVEQYEPDPHKQDLAMIQVRLLFPACLGLASSLSAFCASGLRCQYTKSTANQ
jgi:hypothetical protein